MFGLIDEWMGMEQLRISSEQETMLRLFLLAIRYPDTLLFESLDEVLTADLRNVCLPTLH